MRGVDKQVKVKNYVWPNKKKILKDPYKYNSKKNNGLYLYKSIDFINWKLVYKKPIFHSLIKSKNIPLGQSESKTADLYTE